MRLKERWCAFIGAAFGSRADHHGASEAPWTGTTRIKVSAAGDSFLVTIVPDRALVEVASGH